MTGILAHGYSSESTQQELSNEYQHDRVWMFIKNLFFLVLWMKVALVFEGLTHSCLDTFKYQGLTDQILQFSVIYFYFFM